MNFLELMPLNKANNATQLYSTTALCLKKMVVELIGHKSNVFLLEVAHIISPIIYTDVDIIDLFPHFFTIICPIGGQ